MCQKATVLDHCEMTTRQAQVSYIVIWIVLGGSAGQQHGQPFLGLHLMRAISLT